MHPLPRHVLCLLGQWSDFAPVQEVVENFDGFELDEEFSILQPDPRMPSAFKAAEGFSRSLGDDLLAVAEHTAVAYVLSPPMERAEGEAVSGRALRLVAAVLERGAVAAKSESAGLAHGRDDWLRLAREYTDALAANDAGAAGATLFRAWVQRIIHDDETGHYYSCGLHLLGQPDTEIDTALPADEATEWLDLMAYYVLGDRPDRPILDGHTFGLVDGGPRRVIREVPCTRYDDDEFFFNPYGYRRLVDE